MKIRNLMLVALAASMTFVACSKDDGTTGVPEDTQLKSVTVKLPNISKADTRATGDAIAAKVSLKNYKVFFLNAAGEVQTVPQYEGKPQQVYFSSDAADSWKVGEVTYHFLPAATAKVVVVGNMGDVVYADVDGAGDAALDVLNDTPGTEPDQYIHPDYPLYGTSDLTLKEGEDDAHHANVYTASVTLAPRVARFEIYGFQYTAADGGVGNNAFEKVELDHIALSNYYTKYDFVSMNPSGTVTTAPSEAALVWDWINRVDGGSWNNELTLELNAGEAKFVNGTTIMDPDEDGEGATGIVTYGLTNVTSATNNPELLLSFYGVKGSVKTPLYLRGKFTTSEPFAAGKIYRVLFPIEDGSWEEPERCVELTVDVAQWVVVPVTPEF